MNYEVKLKSRVNHRFLLFGIISFLIVFIGFILAIFKINLIVGVIMIYIFILPTIILLLSSLTAYFNTGFKYNIDNKKIHYYFTFKNKTFEKIFNWLSDLGASLNIRGTSTIYLKDIKFIEQKEINNMPGILITYTRPIFPITKHFYMYFPKNKEKEYYTQIQKLIDSSKNNK